MSVSKENRWIPLVAVVLLICLGATCLVAVVGGSSLLGQLTFLQATVVGTPVLGDTGSKTTPPAKPAQVQVTPEVPAGGADVLNQPGAGGGSDPPTLDPQLSGDATSAEYIVEIYSGLVTLDKDLNIVPDIAERWDMSSDGKVYTFYLRKNVQFHNGKPVRAQDFKWSFERACDYRTRSTTADTYMGDIVGCKDKLRGKANEVSGVKVIDDYTLQLTIDQPRAYFLAKLTYPTAFVLDQENVERGGRTWTDKPNGTGPFKLAEYRLGELIALERNDSYYRDPKPQLKRVNYILSGGSPMIMYEQGQLDMTPVGLNDMERVTDPTNPLNKELQIIPTMSVFYIGMNVKQPPFDDPKVRQAFSYALDRQKIMDVVYKKTVPVAEGIVPPTMPNYKDTDLKPLDYDLEKAKQLISESKYGDVSSFPDITLYTVGAGGATSRLIEAVVASLKDNLGVQIQVQQTDWATFLNDLNSPNNTNQMWDLGWIADYPDPHDFLDVNFRCGSLQNNTGYCNPDLDKLLDQAASQEDPAKRAALYYQAEQTIVSDAPWIPLFFEVQYWLVKPYVKDAYLPPMIKPKLQYYQVSQH
jgi:oligopeptide transport system substrate-binding protein